MSSKEKDAYERAQAEIKGRVQATLGNPRFKAALEELRTLTPAGEPLFGFQIQTKDARAEVPAAEHVELEDGAAVIAAKEAATAYVESVEPTAGLSPRMPTSRVRLNGEPAARVAASLRRQSTQPSIAKGGIGPRPPSLDGGTESTEGEEVEVTGAPAVLDRPAPRPRPAARVANEPASQREGDTSRSRVWIAVAVGVVLVGGVAGLALRMGDGNRGEAVSAASATAPASATPGASTSTSSSASARSAASSPRATAAATATASPSGVEAATATVMPSVLPAPSVVPTTSVTVKPTPVPRSTGEAPAPPKATPPSVKPSGLSPAPSTTATAPPEPAGPAPRYTDPDF